MNPVDAGSMEHDRVYHELNKRLKNKTISREDAIKATRQSDEQLVRHVSNMRRPDAKIVKKAIQSKMKAEDRGILDPLKFVGGQEGGGESEEEEEPHPVRELRKKGIKIHKNKKKKEMKQNTINELIRQSIGKIAKEI